VARFATLFQIFGSGDDPFRRRLATARVRKLAQIGARFGFGSSRPRNQFAAEHGRKELEQLFLFGAVRMIIGATDVTRESGPGAPNTRNSRISRLLIDGGRVPDPPYSNGRVQPEPAAARRSWPEIRDFPGGQFLAVLGQSRIAGLGVTFSVRNARHLRPAGVLRCVEFEIHHPLPIGFSMLRPQFRKRT